MKISKDTGRGENIAGLVLWIIFIILYYCGISLFCWEKISACLEKTDPSALSFLKGWYRKDTNDLEGSYILQDQCVCSQNGEVLTLDQSVEQQISDILFPAAQSVFADDYSLRVAFGGSMTEQEINLGLFSQEGAGRHTLVMIRETEDTGADPLTELLRF